MSFRWHCSWSSLSCNDGDLLKIHDATSIDVVLRNRKASESNALSGDSSSWLTFEHVKQVVGIVGILTSATEGIELIGEIVDMIDRYLEKLFN